MYPPRKDLADIRRTNLRNIVTQWGGPSNLARKLGYNNPSYLVQMVGPKPTRDVTEKTAVKIETALGLQQGALSQGVFSLTGTEAGGVPPNGGIDSRGGPPAGGPVTNGHTLESAQHPIKLTGGHIALAISAVSRGCESLGVKLTTNKFADVVAFVYESLEERGSLPEASRIEQLIRIAA
jgi:hypothetical protein